MRLYGYPDRRPFWRRPTHVAALLWLLLVAFGALLAPQLAPPSTLAADPSRVLLPPGPGHPLGTDPLGRDILARLLWGGRWTLTMGLSAMALAIGIGLPVGLLAGSAGGWVDRILMRLIDAWLAFPYLMLAMAVVAILGRGFSSVVIAIALAAVAPYTRVVRSVTMEVRAQPYIEAARAIGASPLRIVVQHILPNAAPALVAFAGAQLGWVLLNGAALNFLGLGAAPGTPEWGAMLAEGRAYLRDAPWAATLPGLTLTLTVLSINLLAEHQ
ncbi:MAG: ABC transporter permease [Anaerolineae bacterium]|nr:ABC transporter permease [Anaerolineae bacterium]